MAAFLKQYGQTEGPLGFPMSDDQAKNLEALLKTLSAECRNLGLQRVASPVEKAADTDKDSRTDVSFVTTNSLDRDREVVLAAGGDWKQFMKNPVVTFAHDYGALPVGKAMWVKKGEAKGVQGWLAKTKYVTRPEAHPKESEWFPDTVFHYVAEGYMPGKSIGFIPLNYRPAEEKEIRANPSLAKARGVIDKWLALEYAVTPVQSNPDALVTEVSKCFQKGMKVAEFMERAGLVVPDLGDVAPPQETPEEALEKRIAKMTFTVVPPPVNVGREFLKRASAELKNIDLAAAVRDAVSRAKTGRL